MTIRPATLHDAVDQLTKPTQTPVKTLDGITCLRPDPPLLTALANARTANIGQGNGTKAAHERSTLNSAASELHASILRRIRAWARNVEVPQHWALTAGQPIDWTDPTQLLRAWHARTLGIARFDPDPHLNTLTSWINAITDMCIDPPRREVIEAPCPLCGEAWVNPDGYTELAIRTLELAIRTPTTSSTITCRHCHHIWQGLDQARQLRIAIDDAAKAIA